MKKIITILMVLVLCTSMMAVTAFAAGGSISVGSASAQAGQTVSVNVAINSNPGLAYIEMAVSYDANVLTLSSYNEGGALSGIIAGGSEGARYYSWSDMFNSTNTGNYVTLNFTVNENAAPGKYNISVGVTQCWDENEGAVAFSGATGSVTVTCNHIAGAVVVENEKAATCGAAGSYDNVVYCSVCREELSRETITVPATGNHTAGTAVKENEKAATCGAAGSYDSVVYCSVCKEELSRETITVPATGNHTAAAAVKENEKAATCNEAGSYDEVVYCSVCKEELSRETVTVSATGKHTAGEAVQENVVAATCTTDGSYEEVVYCVHCETEMSRTAKTIPAAHTPAAAVRENEVKGDCQTKHSYDEVVYCSVCKEELSRTKVTGELGGHNYGTDGKCTICGKVKDPNLDNQPDTGDIFVEIALYASFAALAVGAVVFAKRKVRG